MFGGIVRPICFAVFRFDHQLKLGGLLDRQIGRLGAFEDLVDVGGDAPVAIREVRPISYESASIDTFLVAVQRW
jgi:hypothetical protein